MATIFSLLLALLCAVGWVGTSNHADPLYSGGNLWYGECRGVTLGAFYGHVSVSFDRCSLCRNGDRDHPITETYSRSDPYDPFLRRLPAGCGVLGRGLWCARSRDRDHDTFSVFCPLWFPTLVFAALPAVGFVRLGKRRWRRRNDRCLTCGYNLTGSVSGACSECGTHVHADASRITRRAGGIRDL